MLKNDDTHTRDMDDAIEVASRASRSRRLVVTSVIEGEN